MSRLKLSADRIWVRSWVAAGLLVAAVGASIAWAELKGPSNNDQYIAKAVTLLLERQHLSRHDIDDEMSERCLKSFLKTLDPMKLYFTQADIDRFEQRKHELDDMLLKGDISFAYTVFNTLLERVDERVKLIDELLAMEHDFTVDEEIVIDREAARYPKDEAEVRDLWRKRIKYDLLVQKADGKTGDEAREKLTRRYHSFARRMQQIDSDELLEMYLSSLTTAYDPHTSYMSPGSLENFEIQMRLELDGIGASLQSVDGTTLVHKLIPGGAADKDGRLKAGDKVIGVGQGEDGEIVDVVDMKLSEVVDLIRGKRGTVVRLQVIPVAGGEPKIYNITRARIELKDSEARSEVVEAGEKVDGGPYRIGVIDLPSFYMDMDGARRGAQDYKSTTRDVRRILEEFKAKGVDAVVLDLRRNGGGALDEAVKLTGLFIDQGVVVRVKDADGDVRDYDDEDQGTAWDGPLVVLISRFSASASEILAGAIQDYQRGLVIGDRSTHGKGTVQSLMDLGRQLFRLPTAPRLGALKLTMQQFYRPNGDSTQNRGVLADIELPSLTTFLEGIGESDLDYAVEFDRVKSGEYKPLNYVDRAAIEQLRRLSRERCQKCPDFQKVARDIERYLEQKNRKTVPLNEEKFMAQRAELDAQKEEEKRFEALLDPESGETVFKRDFYNNEVLAITLDYLQARNVAQAK